MPTRLELRPDLRQRQYQYVEPALIGELRHLTVLENMLSYMLDNMYSIEDIDNIIRTSSHHVDKKLQLDIVKAMLSSIQRHSKCSADCV